LRKVSGIIRCGVFARYSSRRRGPCRKKVDGAGGCVAAEVSFCF
jgi:hypothetical protein